MVLFQAVQVHVTGTGTFSGLALFKGQITSAEVCLRGLNLQKGIGSRKSRRDRASVLGRRSRFSPVSAWLR